RAFGVDARRWLRWILNSPRRSFKLRVLVDQQRPMKNVTLDRTTVLQLDADGTDSALDAAADCDVLRNDVALDLCAIADQELRGAQLTFDSAEDLRWTIAFDVANDRHAGADARAHSRFRRRLRCGLFNDRALRLHHLSQWLSLHDFGRICRRFLGCLALEATQHVRLLFRRHAVQNGPKGCRVRPAQVENSQVRMPLIIGLRKPELPLRWSLRLRVIRCTVPCQGFRFPTDHASHHPFDLNIDAGLGFIWRISA